MHSPFSSSFTLFFFSYLEIICVAARHIRASADHCGCFISCPPSLSLVMAYPPQQLSGLQFASSGPAIVSRYASTLLAPLTQYGVLQSITIPSASRNGKAWSFPTLASLSVQVRYAPPVLSWPLENFELQIRAAVGTVPYPKGAVITWDDVFDPFYVVDGVPNNTLALNPTAMPLPMSGIPLPPATGAYFTDGSILPLVSMTAADNGSIIFQTTPTGFWPDIQSIYGPQGLSGPSQAAYMPACSFFPNPTTPGIVGSDGEYTQCLRNGLFFYVWLDNSDPNFVPADWMVSVNATFNFTELITPAPTGYEYPAQPVLPPLYS